MNGSHQKNRPGGSPRGDLAEEGKGRAPRARKPSRLTAEGGPSLAQRRSDDRNPRVFLPGGRTPEVSISPTVRELRPFWARLGVWQHAVAQPRGSLAGRTGRGLLCCHLEPLPPTTAGREDPPNGTHGEDTAPPPRRWDNQAGDTNSDMKVRSHGLELWGVHCGSGHRGQTGPVPVTGGAPRKHTLLHHPHQDGLLHRVGGKGARLLSGNPPGLDNKAGPPLPPLRPLYRTGHT